MEVNIKNAFLLVVKLTWRSSVTTTKSLNEKVEHLVNLILYFSLGYPFLTTFTVSIISLFLITLILLATMVIVGVLCTVVVIIMTEGFVFFVFALIVVITTATFGLIMSAILKTTSSNKLDEPADDDNTF